MAENLPRTPELAAGPSMPAGRKRRKLRIAWGLALLLTVAAGGWFLRAPLLRGLAMALIVDQPEADQDYLLVVERMLAADHRYHEAARLYGEDPSRRVLLVEQSPERAVAIGARPSYEARSLRGLAAQGVPESAVEWIHGAATDPWTSVRLLGQWLKARPHARLLVLCNGFEGRQQRRILDKALESADAARVSVRGLPDRYCDENNWWQSRRGVKALMFAYLELAFVYWQGESQPAAAGADADQYERMFLERLGEALP